MIKEWWVLSIRQDKLKQFSMKYLFRKDKTVLPSKSGDGKQEF